MDLGLSGKRAIVTGGSRGIGRAVARGLALEGVDVALAARSADALSAAATELSQETGRRVIGVPTDTGDEESVRALVQTVVDELGGVDILVNSAATPWSSGKPRDFASTTDDLVREEVEIKVLGYLRTAREVAPHGINVTVVHPGLTRTERLTDRLTAQSETEGTSVATSKNVL